MKKIGAKQVYDWRSENRTTRFFGKWSNLFSLFSKIITNLSPFMLGIVNHIHVKIHCTASQIQQFTTNYS